MKKLRLFPLLLALALILPSCSGPSAQEADCLTLMGKKSDLEKSYMTKVFDLYETATGKKLKIIGYEDSLFEEQAARDFSEGNVPDIFMHFHNSDLDRFNIDQHFLDLSEEPWVPRLTGSAEAYCRDAQGRLLGLPFWENSVSGCYYNKTVLDSLGLRPAATQAEFDMLCQALADLGRTPICWPGDGCSWMVQFALDPVFADDPELLERINANEIAYSQIPAVTDMVEWLAGAAQKGWFGADYLSTGWDDIAPALASGGAVMTFIWDTWFYTDFTPGKYTVDDFALMPVFMNTADSGTYEGGNLNMMMVNKNSEKLEEALDFLAFCAAPENCNAAFEGIATVSCFEDQTSNIQSAMVTNAAASIAQNQRVSTAASRVSGYSADDMVKALNSLFRGETDVPGCISQMDSSRASELKNQGKV